MIANLDAETRWNEARWTHAARLRAARLGSLARIFFDASLLARDTESAGDTRPTGDTLAKSGAAHSLWLPAEIEPLPSVGPQPKLCTGDAIPDADIVRFWLSDPSRFAVSNEPLSQPTRNGESPSRFCRLSIWNCPVSPTPVTQRVHHRRFLLETRRSLGLDPEHGTWIHTADEARRYMEASTPVPSSAWILKLGYTVAGRHRLLVQSPIDVARIESFLAKSRNPLDSGGALIERWLPRKRDFGAVGWIRSDQIELLGLHQLEVTPRGEFVGIARLDSAVRDSVSSRLTNTFHSVAEHLLAEGYCGPVGIDAFQVDDTTSEDDWVDLCEINARVTFGHLAHEWSRALGLDSWSRFTLEPPAPNQDSSTVVTLLEPSNQDRVGAWLKHSNA